ncbi:hypothetical protein HOE37_02145 [Candidatus Woesearchaeota archaeon]|jgi:hypothetical protein|nr:hypothetical protein [Candidatus Woesearchaeota archaeon]MBT4335842.1 hypothetical protein [Candidatus Woesearchaeota archaeon]MBT4469179.1 hypothetical protein [Candidatus Woesearchaeota archaeon]MBT6744502.1 hypothetical protein [Candidatus Woesearchaeota archaeon]
MKTKQKKTKQTIIVLVFLFCSIYLVTALSGSEISEDTLTLALCYELQELDTGFENYLLANNLDACNIFLSQWDTDGDWFGNEEELVIGTDPEDPTENPNTIEYYGEIDEENWCVQNDNICVILYEEECFDYLGDYDIDCVDSDEDGFYNYEEHNSNTDKENPKSTPWWIDLDSDGYRNLAELRGNSNSLNEDILPGWADTDHDQYSDTYEKQVGTDPFDGQDVPEETLFVGTYQSSEIQETKQTKTAWQIYLAIVLAIMLVVILAIYFIYYKER